MSLDTYVRILGRGPGRSRSLTEPEAYEAMTEMLSGAAAPEAVGALLMLLRMKGETSGEIAGLARAAQARVADMPRADLDWPCYAAGRTRGLPWFLLAARLVAATGVRVLLHGWNGPDPAVRAGLAELDLPQTMSAEEARMALAQRGLTYMPLETFHPALFALLSLREVLGLRSCVNTVCRMLNPGQAPASVQGVFHPSYRLLQADAAKQLGWTALTVLKGGGGEFERHPGKAVTAFGLRDGQSWSQVYDALSDDGMRLADLDLPIGALGDLWDRDEGPQFARDLVLGTAALALETLGLDGSEAAYLWTYRHDLQPA